MTLLIPVLLGSCAGPGGEREQSVKETPGQDSALFDAPKDALGPDQDPSDRWEKEIAFSYTLGNKSVASMADAVTAVTLLLGGSPWAEDPETLTLSLKARHILKNTWKTDETEPLTLGKISFMICQACGIRGGLWMTLFGPSERYCYREAVFLELVTPGSLHRYVSGEDLLNIISLANLFMEDTVSPPKETPPL